MFKRLLLLCSLLFLQGAHASDQLTFVVRVANNGRKAEIVNIFKNSKVERAINQSAATSPWVGGNVNNAGTVVALQNKDGHALDVYDFSANAKGQQYTLCPDGDSQVVSIASFQDGQKPTVMVHGKKIYALGYSVGKSGPEYGLMVWDLDNLMEKNGSYVPNKLLKRASGKIQPEDTLAVINDNGAYLYTGHGNKRTLYKVGTR